MGEVSRIGWTDGTFNPWWGCTEVSREETGGGGCDNCYAREFAKRYGWPWGQGAPRRFFGDKHWLEPVKWNRKAKEAGKRMKVFCASMADILDNEFDQAHRERLWALSQECDWIDWQFLTKRIGNAKAMFPAEWVRNGFPKNIWMGITVVNQEEADRDIGKLLELAARVRWISAEPLLGPVDFTKLPTSNRIGHRDALRGLFKSMPANVMSRDKVVGSALIDVDVGGKIDWVVVGGESGVKPRDFQISWLDRIVNDCRAAGVSVYVKQDSGYKPGQQGRIPDELWIHEFPEVIC
jgi:protein gp37